MMIAMSPDLKIVNGTKGNEPDKDLLEQKLMHPSRITEFGKSTGLAIMSKDNEPRVSFVAYLLIFLIGLVVYGAYSYGHSNGEVQGIKVGMVEMQRLQEAETNKKILEGLKNLEIKKAYELGAGTAHEEEKPKENK